MSSPPNSEAASLQRRRARRRFRPLRLALLLVVVCAVAIFEPDCFRFLAREIITFEAWRDGVSTHIGAVDGSVLEPITLRDTVWIYESDTGPITRVEIQSAVAEFDWRNLLPRSTGHVFQRLTLHGVNGKIQLPLSGASTATTRRNFLRWRLPRPAGVWLAAPDRIEAQDVDFIFQSNHDYVRLADTDFTLSGLEAGVIRAGQIVLKQPWINRTFRNVRGTTAIQDTTVEIANLALDGDVNVHNFSAELDDLARGRLNLEMEIAAFGGNIRVAAQALSEERPLIFEATGTFSQIGVAKLAAFLGYNDAAGGTIKEGKFTFRGPPQQISKATASLRLEATNFQWDSRQWDSLVLGATLMNGRVQVPELALTQGHNRLNLNGEMPLPEPGVAWWQTEFDVNIAAKIDNLTELSALMLPDFQYAAGKANIDGSIRGKDQQFHGQLIVSGTDLKWHNAPIEELHAGVKLNGNEFQITNVSLFNNGDYLRGHGVVNIIGDKQYWGEFHASIEDLAKYSAILQKPIVPEPLAGGAIIDWTGEGSAKGHSGQFSARLRKLRSLGATAALLHPINADFEGSYAPGMMLFDRFLLSDDDSSFTANVGIGNKALSLQGIRLYNKQALWLEGDAFLPLDVWNAWPNTSLATLLDNQTVSKVNLTAYNLELRDASLLTGLKFPIQGIVRGNLVAEGPLGALKTSGKFTLSKAQIPLGWSGDLLTVMEAAGALDGQTLQVAKFTGRHPTGDFSATGQVDFANIRDPNLNLEVTSTKSSFNVFGSGSPNVSIDVSGKLQITGATSRPTVSGDMQIASLNANFALEAAGRSLLTGSAGNEVPPVFTLADKPWSDWKFDLSLHSASAPVTYNSSQPLLPSQGSRVAHPVVADTDLHLRGSGGAPSLTGSVTFHSGPIPVDVVGRLTDVRNGFPLTAEATIEFRDGQPQDPSINLKYSGSVAGCDHRENYAAYATGTLEHPMHFFIFDPPLTEKVILADLMGRRPGNMEEDVRLGLRVPGEFYEGVDVVDWTNIPTPPPAPPTPPAAPTAAQATPTSPAPPAAVTPAPPTAPTAPTAPVAPPATPTPPAPPTAVAPPAAPAPATTPTAPPVTPASPAPPTPIAPPAVSAPQPIPAAVPPATPAPPAPAAAAATPAVPAPPAPPPK
ncbi:MAG: translocation/assembly module TamB domain-containing protein [Chthoniobacter sp.]|nr:translocation/assembly module TamB domain-containing protein [Chthoniobacter sp.]